jgi:hypothetical protein
VMGLKRVMRMAVVMVMRGNPVVGARRRGEGSHQSTFQRQAGVSRQHSAATIARQTAPGSACGAPAVRGR